MQTQSTFHPVHQCNDGLFNAASGKKISLSAPTISMIDIKDIAAALSKICRFGGQVNTFYCVAQHSVVVAAMAPPQFKRQALLHDAAEAYLGDVIKPLKVMLGATYAEMEDRFEGTIAQAFSLDWSGDCYPAVKEADLRALELEHEALQKGNMGPLIMELRKHGLLITDQWAWDHQTARMFFMAAFHDYFNL